MEGRLGPGKEFDVIREILSGSERASTGLTVGPGDDAAVLARPARVVTTDMSVEGIHFRREWMSPEEIGYRATMAALSDLAAMNAEPRAVLVSLAGSEDDAATGVVTAVGRGAASAAREVGASLAGGDVTRSPGPLVVDVVALGEASAPLLRSGARVDDEVWVTGRLGAAAAAVRAMEEGNPPPASLHDALKRPVPRFASMRLLAETGCLTAGIDLSDGLVADAGHIAAASGVRLRIESGRIPIHRAVAEAFGDRALALAAGGGEDYELLVTARPGLEAHREGIEARTGVALTRVGVVEPGEGVAFVDERGEAVALPSRGHDHFAAQPVDDGA